MPSRPSCTCQSISSIHPAPLSHSKPPREFLRTPNLRIPYSYPRELKAAHHHHRASHSRSPNPINPRTQKLKAISLTHDFPDESLVKISRCVLGCHVVKPVRHIPSAYRHMKVPKVRRHSTSPVSRALSEDAFPFSFERFPHARSKLGML